MLDGKGKVIWPVRIGAVLFALALLTPILFPETFPDSDTFWRLFHWTETALGRGTAFWPIFVGAYSIWAFFKISRSQNRAELIVLVATVVVGVLDIAACVTVLARPSWHIGLRDLLMALGFGFAILICSSFLLVDRGGTQ
jgi:hypothetical protein